MSKPVSVAISAAAIAKGTQIAFSTVSCLICLSTSFVGFTIFELAKILFTLLQLPRLNVVSWFLDALASLESMLESQWVSG